MVVPECFKAPELNELRLVDIKLKENQEGVQYSLFGGRIGDVMFSKALRKKECIVRKGRRNKGKRKV